VQEDEDVDDLPARTSLDEDEPWHRKGRRESIHDILNGPQMRTMRLIGNSNPRYRWHQYWKTEEELKKMKKPIRQYYERNNSLIQQYIYIDRLLDSSLPHNLLNEYNAHIAVPPTISEEPSTPSEFGEPTTANGSGTQTPNPTKKIKRTPRDLYRVPTEETPLFQQDQEDEEDGPRPEIPGFEDDSVESGDRIVQIAIYVNLVANTILLGGKIAVMVLTNSLSVLASLVDAMLDFLSTAIVWTTTRLIAKQDYYTYPVGRRRLEPIGVLVFSVIMVTSFFQVALQCFQHLTSNEEQIPVQLTLPAIVIMASTIFIKALCWLWCRLIKNSSVQALAQDAMTDVVFNVFSIIFPLGMFFTRSTPDRARLTFLLVGFYANLWWLDALGGLLLSFYVISNWSSSATSHIRNLTGAAATADERNVLLYLTMRFAKTIKQIQGLQAYHAGDKLNVEVDIVLDENINLRDSHDLGESLQYVLESVPTVDRAFVHQDYAGWNLPSHMQQQTG
jgi:divalent metal cation (Fe/Co/Zn/Cd) transporter